MSTGKLCKRFSFPFVFHLQCAGMQEKTILVVASRPNDVRLKMAEHSWHRGICICLYLCLRDTHVVTPDGHRRRRLSNKQNQKYSITRIYENRFPWQRWAKGVGSTFHCRDTANRGADKNSLIWPSFKVPMTLWRQRSKKHQPGSDGYPPGYCFAE